MRTIGWIARRELGSYLRSMHGYVVLAVVLAIDGLLFNIAVGGVERRSGEVLELFFYATSGTTLIASVFIGMRLIAEERQTGTLILLQTSPVREVELVVGKFLAALAFLAVMTLTTAYMPALILIHGKVSAAHIVAGYLGLLLLGGAAIALVLFASALAPNQLVAAIVGGALVATFVLFRPLAQVTSPPLESVVAYLSLHDRHFRPFMRGLIGTQDIAFYLSLIYLALLGATRALEARRWS